MSLAEPDRDLDDWLYESLTGRCAHQIRAVPGKVYIFACQKCGHVGRWWSRDWGYTSSGDGMLKLVELMRQAGYALEVTCDLESNRARFLPWDERTRRPDWAGAYTLPLAVAMAARKALEVADGLRSY